MNLGLSKEEVKKRVDDALNYMNIHHLIDRPPHYLSGGEKKGSVLQILSPWTQR